MLVRHVCICVIVICVYIYVINNVQRILILNTDVPTKKNDIEYAYSIDIILILMREFKLEFQ